MKATGDKITNIRRDANATTTTTKLAHEILEQGLVGKLDDDTHVIVIVTQRDHASNRGRAGMAFEGYGDGKTGDAQVINDLLLMVQGLAESNGIAVAFAPVELEPDGDS